MHALKQPLLRISSLVALLIAGTLAAAVAAPMDSWYLSRNQMALNAGNRYYSTLNVTNDTNEPVYIRSSVDQLALVEGKRVRTMDTEQSLTISPEEFVIAPKRSVELRIFAKPGLQANVTNQSYYVNLTDASHTQAVGSGAHTGFILSYDFLVSVAPPIDMAPKASDFVITTLEDSHTYRVTNGSTRHIFFSDVYACGNTTQELVDCQLLKDFPKQTLLPFESIEFKSTADMKVLGILMFDDLNMRGLQRVFRQSVSPRN